MLLKNCLHCERIFFEMPLSRKGLKIRSAMRREYGKKKGDRVFYASENKGRIRGLRLGRGK